MAADGRGEVIWKKVSQGVLRVDISSGQCGTYKAVDNQNNLPGPDHGQNWDASEASCLHGNDCVDCNRDWDFISSPFAKCAASTRSLTLPVNQRFADHARKGSID